MDGELGSISVDDATADRSTPPFIPRSQFTSLLKAGVITDMLAAADPAARTFYALAELGASVCGHPGVAHGGVSAALHDDTLGGLAYVLKTHGGGDGDGIIIPPGPAFTVALDVAYKATVPAGAAVLITATVEKVDGRKMWLTSELTTQPDGVVRSTARALFVVPKGWREEEGEGGGVVSEAGVERLARDEGEGAVR